MAASWVGPRMSPIVGQRLAVLAVIISLTATACASPSAPSAPASGPASTGPTAAPAAPAAPKTLVVVGTEVTDNFWNFGATGTEQSGFVDAGLVGTNPSTTE